MIRIVRELPVLRVPVKRTAGERLRREARMRRARSVFLLTAGVVVMAGGWAATALAR